MLGRVSEEEYKRSIDSLGYYVNASGDATPVGVMDRGRLLEFRARVLAHHKRTRGIRDDAIEISAKK
eukprot:15055846-Alexandrium_andersonii.AAC.1